MHLFLIGGNSAEKIRDVVAQQFDDLETTVCSSINEFVELSNNRTLSVDRIFLLQDALATEKDVHSKLVTFNDYVCSWFPAAGFISIMKDRSSLELVANTFRSPFMVHVLVGKMKPVMLVDLVSQRIDVIKKKYGSAITVSSSDEVLDEIIGAEPKKEESPSSEQQSSPQVAQDTGKKKKGSLWGLFGGGKKKKEAANPKQRTYTPLAVDAPVGSSPSESVFVTEENPQQMPKVEAQVFQEDNSPLSPDDETEIDYSVFDIDGAQSVGLGVSITQDSTHKNEENIEGANDFDSFEQAEYQPELFPVEEEEPVQEVKLEEPAPVIVKPEPIRIGLDIHSDPVVTEERKQPLDLGVREREAKLSELRDNVFSKGINIDISVVTTIKHNPGFDIKDVDDDSPILENIDTLSDEYEDQSVKVIEKVVEVQVEKIVNIGGKQKSYKNGIRTIVVTGDRKTGITRTALNMAAYFAKSARTLYVDYDIVRHGSLLYLGLENIAIEEEHVQNGLSLLRNLKTLDSVTYAFPKGGFDCLISTHGTEFEEGRLKDAQRILSTQRDFKTVIIDCPLENMHYLEDIVLYSEVVICVEPNVPCILNTVLGLSKTSENDKFLSFLFNNGHYFLSKDDDVTEFQRSMSYISGIFSLDNESINWGTIPVLGSVVNFEKVLEVF
jgi:hypothetical protein